MTASAHRWRLQAPAAALVASCAAFALFGCGGSDDHEAKPATYVAGVAATGAPIANATVTLKDGRGNSQSATTAADGSFRAPSTGLSPPYLLRVDAPAGYLYSVSADGLRTTTINVTTLTDLATRVWFTVYGATSLDAVFTNPSGIAFPTSTQIEDVEALIDGVFALWLADAGIDGSTNNLISTPFRADGTGIDAVLEQTTVDGWVITISGLVPTVGATKAGAYPTSARPLQAVERTQVTTLSFDNEGKTVTVESEVTAGTEVSASVATTVVPTSTATETAFQQIDADIKAIAETANQKGEALTADDLLPFIDPDLLMQGLNQREWADLMVAQIGLTEGVTFGGYLIDLDQLDTVNGTAHGYFTFTETANGQTATNREESRFRLVDGKWLLSGDGRPGYMYVKAESITDQGGSNTPVMVNASTREGAYLSATVSGWTWTDLPMLPDDETSVDEAGHRFRGFWRSLDSVPPAGTAFTIRLQPPGGPSEEYVVTMNAATGAFVWITSAPEGTAADVIGKTITLAWTLPATVVIDEVNLQGAVHAGPLETGVECDIWGETLGTTATSGEIFIPTTCGGEAVNWVDLAVNVEGVNGEELTAFRIYQ